MFVIFFCIIYIIYYIWKGRGCLGGGGKEGTPLEDFWQVSPPGFEQNSRGGPTPHVYLHQKERFRWEQNQPNTREGQWGENLPKFYTFEWFPPHRGSPLQNDPNRGRGNPEHLWGNADDEESM